MYVVEMLLSTSDGQWTHRHRTMPFLTRAAAERAAWLWPHAREVTIVDLGRDGQPRSASSLCSRPYARRAAVEL